MYEGGVYETQSGFYLEVFDCDCGYHLTLYNSELEEVDGALLETDQWESESFVVTEGLLLCGCIDTRWKKVDLEL